MIYSRIPQIFLSLKLLEEVLVCLPVRGCCRNKVSTRMKEDLSSIKRWQQISAHLLWNYTVILSKHMQRGDCYHRSFVEALMLGTSTAKSSDQDGKAEIEIRLWVLFLQGTQHGHQRGTLTKAQDAIERAKILHCSFHSLYTLLQTQAALTLLFSIKTSCLDIREPPAPLVFFTTFG